MSKYINTSKFNSIGSEELSQFLDQITFKVNSVGVWQSDYETRADYTIDDFELIYYTHGGSETTIMGQKYICKEDDILILDSYGLFTSVNSGYERYEYYFIHFDIEPAYLSTPFMNYLRGKNYKVSMDNKNVRTCFKQVIEEYKQKRKGYVSAINAFIKLICVEIVRAQNNDYNLVELAENANAKTLLVSEAITYIKQHLKDDISVSMLAKKFHVSQDYLYKCFKEVINESVIDFISKTRIDIAKNMLISGKYSIQEISDEVGYSSINHFSRTFKKNCGMSPREYKKQKNSV